MLLKIKIQPTLSLSLAVTLFAINIQCPAYAKTDAKRRQKLVFKILTGKSSSGSIVDSSKSTANLTDTGTKEMKFGGLKPREDKLINADKIAIVGETDKEPPLVSGSNSQLTMTMMGKFKKTWCKTEPFMQLIKEPGCHSRKVMNRFCYGQCNSFYIPRTLRKRMKNKVFKSCGVCKPKRTHTIRVTLKCPGLSKGYKHKKVKQIKQCRCMER